MKWLIKIVTLSTFYFALSCSSLLAQNSLYGIYLSAKDFNDHKISFLPVRGEKYKIHLNETFYKPVVKITIGDLVFILKKDSLFGYRDKDNTIHRLYKNHDYEVLNPDENILLYSRTFPGGYHNSQTIVNYYFSANANAPVLPLAKWNIKNAFPGDTSFHEMLDMYFHSDSELITYDNFYKTYKLNHVFQFSKQMTLSN